MGGVGWDGSHLPQPSKTQSPRPPPGRKRRPAGGGTVGLSQPTLWWCRCVLGSARPVVWYWAPLQWKTKSCEVFSESSARRNHTIPSWERRGPGSYVLARLKCDQRNTATLCRQVALTAMTRPQITWRVSCCPFCPNHSLVSWWW